MTKKIKLLSVGKKKPKKENLISWSRTVEKYAPDMYEPIYSAGIEDTIKTIEDTHPGIVLILPSILEKDLKEGLKLVSDIKKINPDSAIMVNLGMVDDEQEAIDSFMSCGAYKCYPMPVSMDALFHDMFVALNLE